uniref:Ig-like domain-containing protein n=1 Tax=Salarias fasciatus TaxID=181472 RepID=A0A672F558_SALFA
MATASPRTPRALITVFFVLSAAPLPPAACFKVMEGGVASLSCQYSVERFRLSRVCWGRGCGTFWCSNILVQTDEHGVVSKVEERYRLTGDVLDGQMDLDILNVRRTDSGPYCCRVDVDGIFNDKKVIMNLRVVKGEAPETHNRNDNNETQNRDEEKTQQPRLDSQRHTSDSRPSVSLQINVPILSLSLSIFFILAAVISCCFCSSFSSEEPPHIIYEIRMRRPVQENIYTLE